MGRANVAVAIWCLALLAPATSAAGPARAPFERQETAPVSTFWLETRGMPAQQGQLVAARLTALATEPGLLAPAARREQADLIVRLVVGEGAVLNAPTSLVVAAGGDAESADIAVREAEGDTVEAQLRLVDVLGDEVLFDRRLRCQLPLTRGGVIAAACLRANLGGIAELMRSWAEAEAARAAPTRSFGLDEAELAALDAPARGRALMSEAVRATRAGFVERALELVAAAQPLLRSAGSREEEGAAWQLLAYLTAATDRPLPRATEYAQEAVRIAREVADPLAEARALNLLAACVARARNYGRAVGLAGSAARQARAAGDDHLVRGFSNAIIAGVAAARGDGEQALELQREALPLVVAGGDERAELRLRLAMAAVVAQDDDELSSVSLALLDELRGRAVELGDLALWRDVSLVSADTRHGVEDVIVIGAGETDAIRALELSQRIGDGTGAAAAMGLLGTFALRLGRLSAAIEYFEVAREQSRRVGFEAGVVHNTRFLAELVAPTEGVTLAREVVALQQTAGDPWDRIIGLANLSRLQAALQQDEEAAATHRLAVAALDAYVTALRDGSAVEDVPASFTLALKVLAASRVEPSYLARYLRVRHMIPLPDPTWGTGRTVAFGRAQPDVGVQWRHPQPHRATALSSHAPAIGKRTISIPATEGLTAPGPVMSTRRDIPVAAAGQPVPGSAVLHRSSADPSPSAGTLPVARRLLEEARVSTYASSQDRSPEQSREQTEDFLRRAHVTVGAVVAGGITRPQRVELELDGVRRRGLFKSFEVTYRSRIRSGAEVQVGLRDSWKFEVAAYELDRLLDLGMVPVTVARTVDGREGALINWVDGVLPEYGTPTAGFDIAAWEDEVARAWMLDYLAYNIDRIPENLLVIEGFRLRLIDHSRAFQRFLVPQRPLSRFPRAAVERLRALGEADLRRQFGRWLTGDEIDALLERRRRLLRRIDDLLAARPEGQVLF